MPTKEEIRELAGAIAVETVSRLQAGDPEPLEVVFNVFLDSDFEIYSELLIPVEATE